MILRFFNGKSLHVAEVDYRPVAMNAGHYTNAASARLTERKLRMLRITTVETLCHCLTAANSCSCSPSLAPVPPSVRHLLPH